MLDIICVNISIIMSYFFIINIVDNEFEGHSKLIFMFINLIWYVYATNTNLYDEFRAKDFSFEIIAIFKNTSTTIITLVFILFLFKEVFYTRLFVILFFIILNMVLITQRYLFRRILYSLRVNGRNLRNIVIVGAGTVGIKFYDLIENKPQYGYSLLGFLDDSKKDTLNGKYLGEINELENILRNNQIDEVIVALPMYAENRLEWAINTCEKFTTRVKIIPDYFKYTSNRFDITTFDEIPIISVRNDRINEFYSRLSKRIIDISFSLIISLLLLWWLFPIIAIFIKLDSNGPILFKQERWGRDNRKFNIYKFRTMVATSNDVDEKGKFMQAQKNDPRITRIGKILRKSNFDELPQFLNVLIGNISIVGPRPHPTPLNIESKERVRYYMLRHLVKPGITGWAQVNGSRGETKNIEEMQKRVDLDLWYIENWSLSLDIQIILKTIWLTIKGDPNAY